jgi:putative PIG3 family NAD(P)H quinone oxidoreductase
MDSIDMAAIMAAIRVAGGKGGAEALELVRLERPRPKAGEILIRVHAAGVNRPDLLQRQGAYPPPTGAPETLGLEVAGEVTALGEGVTRWRLGDRVAALLGGGGYAEYAVVDARHALAIPDGLDFVHAGALPETLFTVFANVFEAGALQPGETLMVHGATSGIGVAAIQMAKAHGAKVIATSRGADKAAQARALGADLSIDSTAGDFTEAVRGFGGADVILDMVGAAYLAANLAALNPRGRLVQIATQSGAVGEVNLAQIMVKRLVLTGSTLRPRSADEKARLTAEIARVVWPWVMAGKVRAIIDATFPLAQAADAHRRLEAGGHLGKVVLTV